MTDHIDIPHRGHCTPVSETDAAWIFTQGGGAEALKRIAALEQINADRPCPHPATVTDEDGTRCDQCNEPFLGDAHQSELEKAHQTDGDAPSDPLDRIVWHTDGIDGLIQEGETPPGLRVLIGEELHGITGAVADLRAKLAEALEDAKTITLHHEASEKDKCHYRANRDRLAAQVQALIKERDGALASRDFFENEAANANNRATEVDRVSSNVVRQLKAELADAIAQLAAQRSETATTQRLARDARAEADALKAEVAALKGRKVTLPLMYGEPDRGTPPDMAHGWKMHDDAIEACAAAIRAAGVGVANG